MGEPLPFEMPLQRILDLLLTNNKPDGGLTHVQNQLPVVPCHLDPQVMCRADMPRSVT